jgi:hypothetical protein
MGVTSGGRQQLDGIASLDAALTSAGVDYWLFGGWAVDFWVGRITRPHDDIDAAALRKDYGAIRTALTQAGWRHTPVEGEVVGTRYTLRGVEVEFTFVEAREDGSVVIPFPEHPLVWTSEPFGEQRADLDGVRASLIPLDLLRSGKKAPRQDARDGAKDRADAEVLATL